MGKPDKIRVDNGPEFISTAFTDWCREQQIIVQHIQPGKPCQNGYIERFNRTYRQDILDAYLFESIQQVSMITEDWINDYNNQRPHEALNGLTPQQFKESLWIVSLKTVLFWGGLHRLAVEKIAFRLF